MDLCPTEPVDNSSEPMNFLKRYQSKRLLGVLFSNSQSIRWATQGRILADAAQEFRRAGLRAIDVGCGGGSYAIEHHLRHGTPTMLCDYSEDLLSLARQQVADISLSVAAEFVRCSAERLPFPDGSYDFIQCMEVLEHLHQPEVALAEFRRVARPGARLVISVPHPPEWFHNEGHVVEGYTKAAITKLVSDSGWRVIRVEYCMLIFTRLVLAIQQLLPTPLPLIPIIQLENLVPRAWRRYLLPYDIVVVAERPV